MNLRIATSLILCFMLAACSGGEGVKAEPDVSVNPVPIESLDTLVLGGVQDLSGISLSDCVAAFDQDPEPAFRCEYSAEPRLLALQKKLCALYADSIETGQDGRKSLGFALSCYSLVDGEEEIAFEDAALETPGLSEAATQDLARARPLANTETGTWVGGSFLDAQSLSLSSVLSFPQGEYPVQIALGDLVDGSGEPNPDGRDDMIVAFNGTRMEYECGEEFTSFDSVTVKIFASLEDGSFAAGQTLKTGWEDLPMVPFGLAVLGEDSKGKGILGIPAEPIGGRLFECLSEDFREMPLIGTLKRNSTGDYSLESLIADDSDRVILNWAEPMGFARLPDGSGFLGSFSGGGQKDYEDGFSFVGFDGSVRHLELPYKGNVYPVGYSDMELDFGATPFDLALAERDDGTLIMVHTSRINGLSYLADANGLYLTAFYPDGTQESRTLPTNGRPVGLFPYRSPSGALYMASSSAFSADAQALGLPEGPQLAVWKVDRVVDLTPFTSELYSAP